MKVVILFLVLAATGYAQSDEKLTQAEADVLGKILLIKIQAQTCEFRPADAACQTLREDMASLYAQVGKSPKLIRALAMDAMAKYNRMADSAKSAMQVSQIVDQQNAVLIPLLVMQNQRIIELLEQIARKR